MAEAVPVSSKAAAYDVTYKLLLIGDANVGKSSLAVRYLRGEFDESLLATIGIEYTNKLLSLADGTRARLQVWDTAGQERFQSLTTSFYRNTHGVVVVYDVTDRSSFRHVSRWLGDVERHASSTSVIRTLVGNKADLAEEREVPVGDARELAERQGLGLVETSAKTGENVAELFVTMAELVHEQQLKANGGRLPGRRASSAAGGGVVLGAQKQPRRKCCE